MNQRTVEQHRVPKETVGTTDGNRRKPQKSVGHQKKTPIETEGKTKETVGNHENQAQGAEGHNRRKP